MLKLFFTISFRNLLKNKAITAINIAGLTFGITFSILIGLYVKKELSYDKAFINGNKIYRIEFEYPERGKRAVQTSALGPDLKDRLAGIKEVLRIQFFEQIVLKDNKENYFNIARTCVADSTFFDFFDQKWIYGSPEDALNKPYSFVLTDELAKTIFGEINPVGMTLTSAPGGATLTITGVIKKRDDSHFNYDALLSLSTRGVTNNTILHTYSTQQWLTYLMIDEGVNIKTMEEQIFEKLYDLLPGLRDGQRSSDFKVVLNPLKDIYFDKPSGDLGTVHGNHNLVLIFIAIAILIILIACINFINLSTASAMRRAKEVGLRKLVGSNRTALISQFLVESFSISLVSTLLGLAIAELILPYFNNMIGSRFDIAYFDNPYTIPVLAGIIVVTGLLAGIYPAYYISSYKAIQVIRGEITRGRKSTFFRRGLILFQFLISVILINSSLLIYRQLKYTHEKDLGFEKERILTLDIPGPVYEHLDVVRKELLNNPEIVNVSYSYTAPGSGSWNYEGFTINNKGISSMVLSIDPYYIKTMGMEIVAGRDFDEKIRNDSVSNCIINETLAKEIGLENPVDESFHHDSWYITMFPVTNFRIIGIVKDFHLKSFRTKIEPLILAWNPDWHNYMNIKIAEGKIAPAMKKIKETLDEFAHSFPVTFNFVDDSFDQMYKSDQRMGKILIYFTLLAILIGVLGLIGMVTFMTSMRTKEIAIHKVHGASVTSVITKLTSEFILIVLIANAIGWPLVLWLGTKWLNEFAYKTNINIGIFVAGAFVSILVALVTVITVTIRSATLNPAYSLRYE
jgi:putative ABC transport system permease protein